MLKNVYDPTPSLVYGSRCTVAAVTMGVSPHGLLILMNEAILPSELDTCSLRVMLLW